MKLDTLDSKVMRHIESLFAISQNGLSHSKSQFDRERYRWLEESAYRLLKQISTHDKPRLKLWYQQDGGYKTPKIGIRGMIFRKDEVLMVQEKDDGLWAPPGGWADIGCSPSEVVIKEIYEETGLTARVTKLLALYDRDKHKHTPYPHHTYKVVFLCKIVRGTPKAGIEIKNVKYFKLSKLPKLSRKRVTKEQILRSYAHYKNRRLKTDFD